MNGERLAVLREALANCARKTPLPGGSRAESAEGSPYWTPERLEKWCYWTDRIADAMGIIAVSAMGTVFAVILWEWVKLYRSLPPGSMRFMQF